MPRFALVLLVLPLATAACGGDPIPVVGPAAEDTDGTDTGTEDTETGDTETPDTETGDTETEDTESEPAPATWTVMMYEDGDNNLEQVLFADVNEIELAAIPDNVNVIVLFDRAEGNSAADGDWTGAKLFKISHDEDLAAIHSQRLADPVFLGLTDTSDDGEEIDMGAGDTLAAFIDFCQAEFPAEAYALHLSDHGNGWSKGPDAGKGERPVFKGICSDDESGNILSMSTGFPPAIAGKGIDAITFDACLLGTVEVAWSVRNDTDFMGASVMSIPDTGFEYTATFDNWFSGPLTARRWVEASVEEFEAYYGDQSSVGFTAVDVRSLDGGLGPALDAFLAAASGADVADLKAAKLATVTPQYMGWDGMVDFRDLIDKTGAVIGGETPDALIDAFDASIVAAWYSPDLVGLGALSIYAPREAIFGFGGYDEAYELTPFDIDTGWHEFIVPLI
jgi:hypothetical protein